MLDVDATVKKAPAAGGTIEHVSIHPEDGLAGEMACRAERQAPPRRAGAARRS